jgi:hypothetical protein
MVACRRIVLSVLQPTRLKSQIPHLASLSPLKKVTKQISVFVNDIGALRQIDVGGEIKNRA